ncbi:MAG: ABC transporter ATP-binding protein [Lachnospiraceae bacterium]
MYRVLKPDSGAIFLNERPLEEYRIRESAREVAVVAQHTAISFDFTVWEIVLLGRSAYKHFLENDSAYDYKLARQALETVGMSGFEKRSYNELSGGEQRRVILAQALVQQPSCLLLDEPTNHLDIKFQLRLMSIVKKLDITAVCAIHDLNIAAMFCDYLYVLQQGVVVAEGRTKEILTPQLIREIYEVEAQVMEDQEGGTAYILCGSGIIEFP